jgi:hypothetical protein
MNRKTWSMVAVILLILLAAGNAPQALELVRSTWGAAVHGATQSGAGPAAMEGSARAPEAGAPLAAPPLDRGRAALMAAMLLGLAAFLLAVRSVIVRAENRGPRSAVLALARSGRPASTIARRMCLSQDAVRLLLRPEAQGARSRG